MIWVEGILGLARSHKCSVLQHVRESVDGTQLHAVIEKPFSILRLLDTTR